ncbi:MAG: Rrf2 family transcriptional regulator [Candidatus Omnitrophica bacterium]|nr:Rrf2 family transcriptional regulator [Candidatus Omnitrophota bacterium]
MTYTRQTEYGLRCLLHIAKAPEGRPVAMAEIAHAESYSLTFTQKILQKLRSSGLLEVRHGNRGGYLLAERPERISLKRVISALEGGTFKVFCERNKPLAPCAHNRSCGLKSVWLRAKNLLDGYFDSVSLGDLLSPRRPGGIREKS